MSGERQFDCRREDACAVVGARIGRRQEKRRLRQIRPAGDFLHALGREAFGVEDHRERIALEWNGCEDIDLLELDGA